MSPGMSRPTSRGGVMPSEVERQHIGLSDATRRENQKKEHYELQLDKAPNGSDKYRGGALDPLANLNDVAEALGLVKPEEFMQETSNLDHRIEDISRNVRLDHLGDTKNEEKDRQKREDARKQKEAELRRARKREQEARNPQRKVALRLENKRRFETEETKEDPGIPMMRLEVNSNMNRTTVSLVDVRMLRSRCKMLDEGTNVREMLEMDRRKEKEDKMAQERSRGLRAVVSAPELSSPSRELPDERSYEDRLAKIKAKHENAEVDDIIRKLSSCRNKLPYRLPYRFDVKKGHNAARPRLTIAPPMGGHSGREAQVASVLASKFASGQPGSHHASESAEVQKLMGELGRVVVVQEEAKKNNRRKSSIQRNQEDTRKAIAARRRMRKLWAAARATVKVLMLHFQVVRRQGAIELVKNILRQLGEWARVRRSIKRLMSSIKVLQMTCRRYQDYKRRRCEELQRQWLRIEDQHLSAYFRMVSEKAVKEMKDQAVQGKPAVKERRMSLTIPSKQDIMMRRTNSKSANPGSADSRKKAELIQMMEDGLEKGSLTVDWKAYRIPPRDRWAIVNAFYLSRLKKHVRSKGSFLAAVKARVTNEKEMVTFLKMFGADESAVRDFQQSGINEAAEVTPPAFWHLTEDIALRMIALAAQSMTNEKPFQDHPANKDLPSDLSKSRLAIPNDPESVLSGRAAAMRANALLKRLDRPEWTVSLGRLRWRPQKKDQRPEPVVTEVQVEEKSGRANRMSIEDVFSRFTPRLREIADSQQATKSRSSVRKD